MGLASRATTMTYICHRRSLIQSYSTTLSLVAGDWETCWADFRRTQTCCPNMTPSFETSCIRELWRLWESFSDTTKRIHYVPNHAVIRRDKQTTKLRLVIDASAQSGDGPSLNSCMPISLTTIWSEDIWYFFRFRLHKTALAGDNEKAVLSGVCGWGR